MNEEREIRPRPLFQEQLYYTRGQAFVPKRRKITLKEKKVGDSFSFFRLADVLFQPEELCFLEKDELEIKVPSPVQHFCGTVRKQWQRKRFHSLCVLTYDIQEKTSTVQRFYEESSSGEICLKKITTLKKNLESILGPCFSWFVDSVEGEGFGNSEKLRLLLTSQNLCIVDQKLQILYFHQIHRNNPDITVTYNDESKVLEMNFKQMCLWSNNFHTSVCIRVRTGLGEEIKSKLEGISLGRLPATRRVLNWIIDTLGIPSNEEDLEICEDDISPPLPHLPNIHVTLPNPCPFRGAVENEDCTQSVCIPKLIPPRRTPLLRAESMNDLYLTPTGNYKSHVYVNEEYRKAHSKSAHEDGSYSSIYYCNTGWIQCQYPSSFFRNSRHSRLSSEFGDVDFIAMKNHEQWFDKSFKRRSMDKVYSRLDENSTRMKEVWNPPEHCPLNIPLDDCPLNIPLDEPSCGRRDDVYWNTELCLCIHGAFESKLSKADLMIALDVTWEQLLALFIHLDVNTFHIQARDWKDFAGLLDLTLRDIEIIQHFCYTYREWPMFILLSYWMLLSRKPGGALPLCCHTELRYILERLGRQDLLKFLTTRNTNEHIQLAQENEDTPF
ncbi:uncharacterized protein LOC117323452 [Pecten maximus]|uniref:uncharacterized protein LOC117323452 n=1 Tax=Pecten maximus TaxID=6579 RepID=UPI001458396B|nr:uncharacterized protein LOC117323452 [Pecten maximus]